jgi:hypothetical protein
VHGKARWSPPSSHKGEDDEDGEQGEEGERDGTFLPCPVVPCPCVSLVRGRRPALAALRVDFCRGPFVFFSSAASQHKNAHSSGRN